MSKKLTADEIAQLSNREVEESVTDKRKVPVLLKIRNNIRKAKSLQRRWAKLHEQMSRSAR